MTAQDHQYIRIKNVMINKNPDVYEFEQRLATSLLKGNKYYLGLLMMTILSISQDKRDYLRVLIRYGADINFTEPRVPQSCNQVRKSILMIACHKSISIMVKELLQYEELMVAHSDSNGENALHYALLNPRQQEAAQMFRIILKDFPHMINSTNKVGKTLLMSICEEEKTLILPVVLKYVDPNSLIEPAGLTALHYIITLNGQIPENKVSQMAEILLENGANPSIANHLGEDCFDYADKYLFDLQRAIQGIEQRKEKLNRAKKEGMFLQQAASINTATQDEELSDNQSNYLNIKQQFLTTTTLKNKNDSTEEEQEVMSQSSEVSEEEQETFDISSFESALWSLQKDYEQEYQLAAADVEQIINFVRGAGYELGLEMHIIGSFATGLWSHYSDIDIALINKRENFVNIKMLLKQLYSKILSHKSKLKIRGLYWNQEGEFPNIKIEKNSSKYPRKIQVGIFQRKSTGLKYVEFISGWVCHYPIIRPLFYVFHKFLENFNLHRPNKFGLKTYTIFLIIIASLQAYPAYTQTLAETFSNLVFYLNQLFQYEINYIEKVWDYENNRFDVKMKLNIIDPLNNLNNMGGQHTDIERLISMLKILKHGFSISPTKDKLEYLLSLHNVFQ